MGPDRITPTFLLLTLAVATVATQRTEIGQNVRPYIKVDAPLVALTHARVIDGTGAAARENQTLVIRDGSIAAVGDDGRLAVPEGAAVIDLTGKSVIPGLVMVHEHFRSEEHTSELQSLRHLVCRLL